jgi:hypothetical protein
MLEVFDLLLRLHKLPLELTVRGGGWRGGCDLCLYAATLGSSKLVSQLLDLRLQLRCLACLRLSISCLGVQLSLQALLV